LAAAIARLTLTGAPAGGTAMPFTIFARFAGGGGGT
jgi:hypothetical protein